MMPPTVGSPTGGDPECGQHEHNRLNLVVLIVLGLLLAVMVVQTVYVLSYGTTLRTQQDALICQAKQTSQLRDAAAFERQAQRDLLTVQVDPAATPAQRQEIGKAVTRKYLDALQRADAERAAVPPCPALDAISQSLDDRDGG